MNKHFTRTISLFLFLSLLLSLAACSLIPGQEEQPAQVQESAPPVETTPEPVPEAPPAPEPVFIPVSINEVMASNKSTLADDDGLFPDWVELYNYGSEAVDLSGFYLCCGGERWAISGITLEPDAYLVVFCSGDGRDNRHSSFTISKDGATLTLESEAGSVVERFDLPASGSDESVYRSEDGDIITTRFATPGFENSTAGYEQYLASRSTQGPLVISEAMVYNQWYLPQNGEYPDWVEVRNISDSPVELSDYYLSDSGSDRAFYQLPAYTLEPGQTYVILCSDELESATAALAAFGLNAEDDQLFLSYQDGTLIDYAHLHDIPTGCSFGRQDGEEGFFLFTAPTPGSDNTGGARVRAEMPVLLGSDGVYNNVSSVTVELTGTGTVYYTLDGSAPSSASLEYTGPITLTSTTVVRAVNVAEGQIDSDILNLSFIINENHTMPVVSIVADPADLFGGSGIYSNPTLDKEIVGAAMLYEDGSSFTIDCGIKLHGATSKVAQSKKSFKLCFRSRYDGELEYNLFDNGITDFSSILLRAAQESTYSTLMRDNIMHQLAIQCFPELPAQDYKYSVLYINGEYWGIYNIREAHSTTHYANHYGYDESTVVQWKGSWDSGSVIADMYSFAQSHSLSNDDNYNTVAEHLNIDSIIGWCILEAYCGNYDCNPPNMRFYYSTEDEKMSFALVDLDLGFFTYDMYDIPLNAGFSYNDLLKRLMGNKQFQLAMAEQLSAALTGPMSDENVLALIDSLADELRPEMQRNRERWALGGSGDTVEHWENGAEMVQYLRDYVSRKGGRAAQIAQSFINHADLTSAEIEQYFGDILN